MTRQIETAATVAICAGIAAPGLVVGKRHTREGNPWHNAANAYSLHSSTLGTAMRRSLFVLLLMLATGSASAQSYLSPEPTPSSIADRFRLEVDLFYPSYDTNLHLDVAVVDPTS